MNETAPGLFQKCPYKLVNISKAVMKIPNAGSVFPSGDYKLTAIVRDINQKFMGNAEFVGTINSAEKNSFG